MKFRVVALLAALLQVCAAGAYAQTPAPALTQMVSRDAAGGVTVRASRATQPPIVDGRLDEEMYRVTPAIGGFIQQEPQQGQPATDKTEAWIFFDDRNIYFSVKCWSSNPDAIVANELRRDDQNIFFNDNIGVSLDTFHDRRSGVFFQINPLGGLRDGAINDERNPNFDYNAVWDVKTGRFDQGWTAEIVIPFKSLRFRDGRDQEWGLIIQRVVRSKNELSYVVPMPASYGGSALWMYSSAATLVGIEAPPSGTSLDIKPFVTSDLTTNHAAATDVVNDPGADFGVDLKYGVTKSLTFDATYNTDFAQVEADDQQVNLTRFNLLFPERREFFLEGQGIFAFGGVDTRPNSGPSDTPILFFSRQIGLSNGENVPIRAGGRLTGRAGRYTIGLLDIQTGELDSAVGVSASTNFSVVRVKRDILRRSSIGLIGTGRTRTSTGSGSNTAAGIDAALQFYQNVQINAYYARTATTGRHGDEASYRTQFKYGADRYGAEFDRLKVGGAFNPDIGFLRRQDFLSNYGLLRFSPRPKTLPGIRKISVEGSGSYVQNGAGRLESRIAQATFKTVQKNGDTSDISVVQTFDSLKKPFAVSKSVVLPVQGYAFRDVRANYQLGPQRAINGTVSLTAGEFYSGHRAGISYAGRIGVIPRVVIEPRFSVDRVRLPEGNFNTKLVSTRTSYALSPRAFVAILAQYNSSTDTFGTNIRFRWEYQPGSDFFVVYSDGRDTSGEGPSELMNRKFAVKFTRLFRF